MPPGYGLKGGGWIGGFGWTPEGAGYAVTVRATPPKPWTVIWQTPPETPTAWRSELMSEIGKLLMVRIVSPAWMPAIAAAVPGKTLVTRRAVCTGLIWPGIGPARTRPGWRPGPELP